MKHRQLPDADPIYTIICMIFFVWVMVIFTGAIFQIIELLFLWNS